MLLLIAAFVLLWVTVFWSDKYREDWYKPLLWCCGVLGLLICLSNITPPYIVNEYPLVAVNGYYAVSDICPSYNFIKDSTIVHEDTRTISFCVGASTPFIRKYSAPWWWVLVSLRCNPIDEIHLPSMNYIMPQKPVNPIIIRCGGNAK